MPVSTYPTMPQSISEKEQALLATIMLLAPNKRSANWHTNTVISILDRNELSPTANKWLFECVLTNFKQYIATSTVKTCLTY